MTTARAQTRHGLMVVDAEADLVEPGYGEDATSPWDASGIIAHPIRSAPWTG